MSYGPARAFANLGAGAGAHAAPEPAVARKGGGSSASHVDHSRPPTAGSTPLLDVAPPTLTTPQPEPHSAPPELALESQRTRAPPARLPEPEPSETEAQRKVRELLALPMAGWSAEQVITWCWVKLPEWAADVAALDLDGQELTRLLMRGTIKHLKHVHARHPEAAAQALLAGRDAVNESHSLIVGASGKRKK